MVSDRLTSRQEGKDSGKCFVTANDFPRHCRKGSVAMKSCSGRCPSQSRRPWGPLSPASPALRCAISTVPPRGGGGPIPRPTGCTCSTACFGQEAWICWKLHPGIERRAYVSFFLGLIVLKEGWCGKRSGEGLGKPGRRWDGRASRDMQSAGQTTFGRFCGSPFQLSVS